MIKQVDFLPEISEVFTTETDEESWKMRADKQIS
jgi:hypothetical protein